MRVGAQDCGVYDALITLFQVGTVDPAPCVAVLLAAAGADSLPRCVRIDLSFGWCAVAAARSPPVNGPSSRWRIWLGLRASGARTR